MEFMEFLGRCAITPELNRRALGTRCMVRVLFKRWHHVIGRCASGRDLLSVAIDRSVEPNRKHRVELKAKYSRAVRKDRF